MVTPIFAPFPAAPSRAEGRDDFSPSADTFAAALPPFALKMNEAITWMSSAVTAITGSQSAASDSARAAAQSAETANTAKLAAQKAVTDAGTAGAQQVQLAKDQVALATAAKGEAQAAAQAAGAAAGLPSPRVPHTFLKVRADGVIAWGARDQIGQVVMAIKAQDASYIQTGGVYLQSSYPELYQVIGKLPTPGVYSFQGVTNTGAYTVLDLATDGKGTWVAAVSDTTGSSTSLLGYVLRSVDDGRTWAPISVRRVRVQAVGYVNETWVVVGGHYDTSNKNVAFSISVDGGVTWSIGTTDSNLRVFSDSVRLVLEVGEGGGLVLTGTDIDIYSKRFVWTSLFLNAPSGNQWSGYSSVVGMTNSDASAAGAARSGGFNIVVTTLGRMSRVPVTATGTTGGNAVNTGVSGDLKAIASKAGTIIAVGASGTVARSTDDAATFRPSAVSGTPDFRSVEGVGGGVWVAGTSTGVLWISLDDGFTFTETTPSGLATAVTRIKAAGNTIVLNGGATIRRSESLYSYDQNTQFIVPAVTAPSGMKTFIKAREAA